ncbi:family C58 peptidase [Rahnella aquatilis CIP 78.65 = ATCC 33071]|nr:family C58 peptidase [Rahnella aquatilis CIP 78.65 = ATCC 33071]
MEYGFESGVCQGLIGAYLISGQNWPQFSAYISSERGKAVVRGIMNFQEHLSASGNMKEMKNVFHGILKPHRVNFIREEIRLTENTPIKMSQAILKNITQGNGFHISIKKASGGHSLGIRADASQIKFFDPNYGEIIFAYKNGMSDEMERFLTHVFSEYYSQYFMLTIEHYSVH